MSYFAILLTESNSKWRNGSKDKSLCKNKIIRPVSFYDSINHHAKTNTSIGNIT